MVESKRPTTGDPGEIARGINSGAIHILRALRAVDGEAGLTPARLSALSVLVFGGPSTLGRLAETEEVAGPTMTRIVDGLCALGLAERRVHPDSARFVQIAATRAGKALMRKAAKRRIDTIVSAMGGLPLRDQQRLAAAAPLLLRVASGIRADDRSRRGLADRQAVQREGTRAAAGREAAR